MQVSCAFPLYALSPWILWELATAACSYTNWFHYLRKVISCVWSQSIFVFGFYIWTWLEPSESPGLVQVFLLQGLSLLAIRKKNIFLYWFMDCLSRCVLNHVGRNTPSYSKTWLNVREKYIYARGNHFPLIFGSLRLILEAEMFEGNGEYCTSVMHLFTQMHTSTSVFSIGEHLYLLPISGNLSSFVLLHIPVCN